MAEDITDGSLSWQARIDTSELAGDIKSIAELLQQVGANIDLSSIDKILSEQAAREVNLRKDVATQAAKINDDLAAQQITVNGKVFDDAKQKAGDMQKYIESVAFDIKTNTDKLLSQAEIDAINAQNKGVPITNKSPDFINQPNFQSGTSAFQNTDAINQARDAYKNADLTTKQYFDDITSLEFQLKNLTVAQTSLNNALKGGTVNEQQYLTQSAELKAAIEGVTTELTGVKNAQATYVQGLNGEGQATQRNVSILTEYRQLRNQIAADKVNGIFNEADLQRATELEHAIRAVNNELHLASSNVALVEAASEGIRGLVGAFSALSGVVGLFTKDNETANRIMQDTISFLGIINGLEQISQVLATNGKLNLYINSLLRKNTATAASTVAQVENNTATVTGTAVTDANVVATEASEAAKVGEATATESATVAQEGLNVAMSANPAAILVLAITAIVTAYELFADGADKAAESQKKLNDALELAKFYSDDALDSMKRQDAETIAQMKASGASEQSIRDTEKQQLRDQYDTFVQHNQATIDAGKKASEQLNQIKANNGKIFTGTTTDIGTGNIINTYVDATDKDIDELKATVDKAAAIEKEKNQLASDLRVKDLNNQTANNDDKKKAQEKADADAKKAQEKALANDTEYWQAKVELARKGTQEWLDAQLKLNQAQYNKAIASGANPEKAQADKTIADQNANDTVSLQTISDTEDLIDKQLTLVSKGSHDELALKLQLLEQEKQAALINAHDNAAAIEKINAESLQKQSDLKKQYAATDAETFESIQQNQLKIILSQLSEGSEEFAKFSQEANKQAATSAVTEAIKKSAEKNPDITAGDIEISSIFDEKSALAFADRIEKIDKELATKIRASWAETDAKNLQVDNDFVNNYIDNKNKIIEASAEIAKTGNNAIINNPNATNTQKAVAESNNNQIDIDAEKDKLQGITDALQAAADKGDEFSQKYKDAKSAVDTFITDVQKDSGALKNLSDPTSAISKALDAIKDPKVKEELEKDLTGLKDLNVQAVILKQQKFDAILKDVSQFGSYISQAGQDISEMNAGLGDTLSTLGDLITVGADLALSTKDIVEGFKSVKTGIDAAGNAMHALDYASVILAVITTVIKVISSVVKLFSQAKKTAEDSQAAIQAYQTQLTIGQVQYNEQLLTSKKIQDDITQGMLDQLNAQIQLNNEKKTGYQTDLDTLTAQLAQTGQYISGEHTEKYGGFLGIGQKTKVVQDFSSLGITTDMTNDQIAAILKEKEALNELTGDTKTYADEWLSVYDNITQANDASIQLKEQLTEAFSGTTADDIAKSIVSGLEQGKVAAAQWGDDFNKIISNALLSSITNTLESGAVQKIWQTLQANINADGSVTPLSPEEIATLQKQYSDAVDQGNALLQQAEAIFPDLASTLNSSNTLAGAIQGSITEDTANELAGLYRNQLDTIKESYQIAVSSLNVQMQIEANTAQALALFSAHLPMLTSYLPYLKTINDNTAPEQLRSDFH